MLAPARKRMLFRITQGYRLNPIRLNRLECLRWVTMVLHVMKTENSVCGSQDLTEDLRDNRENWTFAKGDHTWEKNLC